MGRVYAYRDARREARAGGETVARAVVDPFVSCAPWHLAPTVTLGESGVGSPGENSRNGAPLQQGGLRGLAVTARETRRSSG